MYLLTFPVLICVLESLDQPQSFIHRASHRQIIDGDLAKDTLAVDDKEAPEDSTVYSEELGAPRARGGSTDCLPATRLGAGRALP